jgi:hypothetical protein
MTSSGMLRRVALVRIDVSEELSASFIRATRIGELGTTLAVISNWLKLLVTLLKEALSCSETWVLTTAKRRNIPEDAIFIVTAVKTSNLTRSFIACAVHRIILVITSMKMWYGKAMWGAWMGQEMHYYYHFYHQQNHHHYHHHHYFDYNTNSEVSKVSGTSTITAVPLHRVRSQS